MEKGFTENDWDGYAKVYDVIYDLKPFKDLQAMIVKKTDFAIGHRIIDCACGNGNFAFTASSSGSLLGAEIFGLDISDEMLKRAKQRCGNVYAALLKADLDGDLPFRDGYFDQAVSTLTLYALPRPGKFLNEIRRILVPGGKLILTTPKAGYENGLLLKAHCGDKGPDEPWLGMHESAEREIDIIRMAFGDSETGIRLLEAARYNREIRNVLSFYFPTAPELKKALSESGFSTVEFQETSSQDYFAVAAKEG